MFDFGAVVDGYCSDFGRTVCVGEPAPEVRDAYELVLAAQEAGRAALRPGVHRRARSIERAAEPIEEAGHGAHFKHRMGHGIGLDVHERPFVSEEDDTVLEAGHDVHRRAVDPRRRSLRRSNRGRRRMRAGRWAQAQSLRTRARRQRVSGAAERVDRPASKQPSTSPPAAAGARRPGRAG